MYYVLQIRNNLTTKHKKINIVFYYKNHLDPFFISVSIFKYGFDFSEIIASAKIFESALTLLSQTRRCFEGKSF